jgi:hypothetical protein
MFQTTVVTVQVQWKEQTDHLAVVDLVVPLVAVRLYDVSDQRRTEWAATWAVEDLQQDPIIL